MRSCWRDKVRPAVRRRTGNRADNKSRSVTTVDSTEDSIKLRDLNIKLLNGDPAKTARHEDLAVLVVNVASKCGLTGQYAALERLQQEYSPRGFTVLGVPCNQFMDQEPGTSDEIAEFCSTNYGVTFPLTEKLCVNGADRHPLYAGLVNAPDATGYTGDIRWNFEKFLLAPGSTVVARFAPATEPDLPEVRQAIEEVLPF